MSSKQWTPRQFVAALDEYIIGQKQAKKAISVAVRNRYRRSLLDPSMRDDVVPKNVLMIGPTGVGKTEIARRIAKLTNAPFLKVEATKFTEVGYVGRDVESMIRDLLEVAIRMVKSERIELVKDRATELANERLVSYLAPAPQKASSYKNPLESLFGQMQQGAQNESNNAALDEETRRKREQVREQLFAGKLENSEITIEVDEQSTPLMDMMPFGGNDAANSSIQDMFGAFMPKRKRKRTLKVSEARRVLLQEEANALMDMDEVHQEAIRRTEQFGILFIDEIDKIAAPSRGSGPDVSREGVQRDILPIVEGSTVNTKYGSVKTDYILFIAAGAFHVAKPSDLMPELQGRFPIRVELQKLTQAELVRILTEPKHALTKQYAALLQTEGIELHFTDEAIHEIARIAAEVNEQQENIGARRLHTVLERLLEDLSFEAPDLPIEQMEITPNYVREKLAELTKNRDLSQYIL